ncbi:RNA polymerase sigma-70 factor [Mucilaginibacter sp.]|uniref:RNA polymerase sigma-70 factor n=1 Tax=Mucilaginibacter sp. TaxID=1882438 RepID=UPI00263990BF|nr:RNA polymerase sigma-70 factor [Mucilaginibacter sp.]MDB5128248.1 polymerase sigma-70 factor [Mucilaginibacter sp.]
MKQGVQLTDCKLLELFTNGNDAAFAEIYNRYWKKLIALSYSYTKDKFLAEEIVQEVFVSLWNRRGVVKIETLSSYLATAIKFSVFKNIYTKNRHERLLEQMPASSIAELPEDLVHAKFLEEYVNGLVEQLPEKCRLVYKYSRQKGLSPQEIAEEMNIAKKTVEAHLTKALKMLRLNLKEMMVLIIVLKLR